MYIYTYIQQCSSILLLFIAIFALALPEVTHEKHKPQRPSSVEYVGRSMKKEIAAGVKEKGAHCNYCVRGQRVEMTWCDGLKAFFMRSSTKSAHTRSLSASRYLLIPRGCVIWSGCEFGCMMDFFSESLLHTEWLLT